jgi:colanic acid biosynthesis glycosyl transferase WcaI
VTDPSVDEVPEGPASQRSPSLSLVVVTPHFAPDVAPTGELVTRIVTELGRRGHRIEVVTSLPWYRHHRIDDGWNGRLVRREDTPWGRVTRVHPFPTADKRNVARRALSYGGFSLATALMGAKGARVDSVLALSPPLTLGLTGWALARARRAPFVFNVQDVYPDVAVELGAISNPRVIGAARVLERFCYARADAVTVLSEDMRDNVAPRLDDPSKVRVIPNFVDTAWIRPLEKDNSYRREFGLDGKTVVMYAGNVGLSQSLDLVLHAASSLAERSDVQFVVNGGGAGRDGLREAARDLGNITFVDMQPVERLPEILAAADVHLVPLKRGLAKSSVPSKIYSILAAARPLVASVDVGSEVAGIVEASDSGVAVPPEEPQAFVKGLLEVIDDPNRAARGRNGRAFVENWASPSAVATRYTDLFEELAKKR